MKKCAICNEQVFSDVNYDETNRSVYPTGAKGEYDKTFCHFFSSKPTDRTLCLYHTKMQLGLMEASFPTYNPFLKDGKKSFQFERDVEK